jgi:peptidoglycan hydrolase-like protein with peptidoglycan-binding domain
VVEQAVFLGDKFLDAVCDLAVIHPLSIRRARLPITLRRYLLSMRVLGAVGAALVVGLLAVAPSAATGASGPTGTTGATGATSATGATGPTAPLPPPIPNVTLRPEERGAAVRILQSELRARHYVVGRFGIFDARTRRAVLAFRKVVGMKRSEVANHAVFRKLAQGAGAFKVRYPYQPPHVEGDLTHQVLALIGRHGHVERIYPMSSGRPGLQTQPGIFRVYMQELGITSDGMVDSSFFNGGDAIHGYHFVPPYPWSHGCLRVPIPDALSIHNWLHIGTIVDVYYR